MLLKIRDAGTLKSGLEFNRKEANEFIVISFHGGTEVIVRLSELK